MTTQTVQELFGDINTRLAAIGESVSEEKLKTMINERLDQLLTDETFVRKMRFGSTAGTPKLVGSKFARWGLGVADVEWLMDVLESAQRVGRSPGPSEELRNAFKEISEAVYIPEAQVREMDRKAIDNLFPRIPRAWLHGRDQALHAQGRYEEMEAYQRALAAAGQRTADSGSTGAMDTAESGYGSQLVGAQYVRDLWDGARAESRIFALLDTFEMTDPTAYLPVEADLPEMLFVAENTIRDPSVYTPKKTGSQRVQVDAKKFVIHQIWSGEMEEDSIIPLVAYYRRQAQLSLAHYSDSLVLNGDTTTGGAQINTSSDPAATEKHYLALDGIRHVGLVDNTGNQKDMSGAAITFDALLHARGRMIDATYLFDWGHPNRAEDLVYAAEPNTADAIALLAEFITIDKFGSNATVLTGQVGRIGQHPLIPSMALSKTLATGFVHASTGNNYGVVVPFNRRGFKIGWRRRIKVETERIAATDQSRIVYSLRLGMGRYSPTGAVGGIECADIVFDILL